MSAEEYPTGTAGGIGHQDWLAHQVAAAALMSEVLARIGTDHSPDWSAPTPCTEWSARDLLAHVVTEQVWIPGLLAGGTLDEVADDLEFRLRDIDAADGDRLAEDWAEVVAPVGASWRGTPADARVHLSYGEVPVTHFLAQQTCDTAVHAWDLAVAHGLDVIWDDALARAVLAFTRADFDESLASGLFAPPVPGYEGSDADPRDAAVALNGRDPRWAAPVA